MKILMVNGSPRKGETRAALEEMGRVFAQLGADYEIADLGAAPVNDCIACGKCAQLKKCAIGGDAVNALIEKAEGADGFVFGTPVYYAHPSARVLAVLDALPALGILEACSFITMLSVNACAPGSFTMVEVAISVLLGTGFSLVAALDGVEVTFIRVGVTSVVGLVLLLAAAGLLALWAPIAVIYGLVVVDLAFIALLENGK